MIRKAIPSMIIALLVIAGPAAADIYVTPYGGYTYFKGYSSEWTLDFDTPVYQESVPVSQLDSSPSIGLGVGYKSVESGLVLGLNAEYFSGVSDFNFVPPNGGLEYRRSIKSTALAVGAFIGTIIGGNSGGNFQSVVGLELGVLLPKDTFSTSYTQEGLDENNEPAVYELDEEVEVDYTVPYMSFLFTENYSFSDLLGVYGTLGWRTSEAKIQEVEPSPEAPSISGGYAQNYGGFFFRLGLSVIF